MISAAEEAYIHVKSLTTLVIQICLCMLGLNKRSIIHLLARRIFYFFKILC